MSTTAADLIRETARHLYSGRYDPMNKLSGAISSTSATTITGTYDLGAITTGAYIAVDLEIMLVWAVIDASAKTFTVERGVLGSTAATHSDGAIITINPKFSDFAILTAINEDLDDLSGPDNGLFAPTNVTLTYNPAVRGYDLASATSVIGILRVRAESTGPEKDWPEILRYDLIRAADTTDFASGFAIVLGEPGWAGKDIRVEYAAKFGHFTATADVISTSGLPATANDLPPLGAALRLQYMREPQRNFNEAQPDPRRAQEVGAGAQLQAARGIEALRMRRIRNERSRLRKDYPHKRKLA